MLIPLARVNTAVGWMKLKPRTHTRRLLEALTQEYAERARTEARSGKRTSLLEFGRLAEDYDQALRAEADWPPEPTSDAVDQPSPL